MQVPSLWRIELLHPLCVHFPIAFLSLAAVLSLFLPFFRERASFSFLAATRTWLLCAGVLAAWLAFYAGSMAEDVVNRVICDPTVTHRHEDLARLSSLLFSAALILVLGEKAAARIFPERVLLWLQAAICAAGLALLIPTAHLGASLVYQQGAAVYRPSAECLEFE